MMGYTTQDGRCVYSATPDSRRQAPARAGAQDRRWVGKFPEAARAGPNRHSKGGCGNTALPPCPAGDATPDLDMAKRAGAAETTAGADSGHHMRMHITVDRQLGGCQLVRGSRHPAEPHKPRRPGRPHRGAHILRGEPRMQPCGEVCRQGVTRALGRGGCPCQGGQQEWRTRGSVVSNDAGEGRDGESAAVDSRIKGVATADHAVEPPVQVAHGAAHRVGGHVLQARHDAPADEAAVLCRVARPTGSRAHWPWRCQRRRRRKSRRRAPRPC